MITHRGAVLASWRWYAFFELLEKLKPLGAGAMPVTGMVAATASLKPQGWFRSAERSTKTSGKMFSAFWSRRTCPSFHRCPIASWSDVKKPGAEVVKAMAAEKVYIGRVWPAWPTHVRVTVGTAAEMEKFKTALTKVLA